VEPHIKTTPAIQMEIMVEQTWEDTNDKELFRLFRACQSATFTRTFNKMTSDQASFT
jgi:hypothetical protein